MESFQEGSNLLIAKGTSKSKEIFLFLLTDTHERKYGYQPGLGTRLVHTTKYEYLYII